MAAIDAGMNIAEVEALGTALAKAGDDLARHAAALDKLVKSAAWKGAVATNFKQQWWPQHRSRLGQIEADVRRFGQCAITNAQEQRKASEVGEGAASLGGRSAAPTASPTLRDIIRLPMEEQVAAWNGLTWEQKKALLEGKEASLGELSFVAPEIRYAANRQLMTQLYLELNDAELKLGTLPKDLLDRKNLYEGILTSHQQVLFFDPTGDGRIAVVQGDLTHAQHLAVLVPGISTDMGSYWETVSNGQLLHKSAGADTAIVSWLGYDAPTAALHGNQVEIVSQVLAKSGAETLVGFVKEMRATNTTAGLDVTVIGHSYGSLVTGLAAHQGLDADKIVFIGSPGVGVASVNDFNLREGARVFAAEPGAGVSAGGVGFGGDPVSNLGHNLHPFGAVPTESGFGAEVVDIGDRFNVRRSHGDYFKSESLSLQKLGSIVRVEGDDAI